MIAIVVRIVGDGSGIGIILIVNSKPSFERFLLTILFEVEASLFSTCQWSVSLLLLLLQLLLFFLSFFKFFVFFALFKLFTLRFLSFFNFALLFIGNLFARLNCNFSSRSCSRAGSKKYGFSSQTVDDDDGDDDDEDRVCDFRPPPRFRGDSVDDEDEDEESDEDDDDRCLFVAVRLSYLECVPPFRSDLR